MSDDLPDGTAIGDYRLHRLLGEGAAGRVYLASPTRSKAFAKPGDPLAVNFYKEEILRKTGQLDRIEKEFRVGSTLAHPNLVRMFEHSLGEEGTRPFLVMEYVDGIPLDSWIRYFNPVPSRVVLRIIRQLVDGVKTLHAADVVHRDIKPQNAMLTSELSIKVMDLGVVRISHEPPLTPSDEFLGSIRHSSPEMLFGEVYDARTDLYSLGTIVYALLHGEQIFADETQFARLVEMVKSASPEFDPAIESQDEVSRMLVEVTRALVAKDPNTRPKTIETLQQQLHDISQQLPDAELDPLHGYVATALTDLPPDARDTVNFMANLIADVAKGYQLFMYQPRRSTDPLTHADISAEAVYLQDRKRVASADLVVVVATHPSFGVGQEIEIAAAAGKPAVIVKRKGQRLSRMVEGSFTNILDISEYETPEDVVRSLRRGLPRVLEDVRAWRNRLTSHASRGIGPRVREAREAAGYRSAREFAETLKLQPRIIEALEQGEYELISYPLLASIAEVLETSVAVLLDETAPAASEAKPPDENLRRLEALARTQPWTAAHFFELRDEYLKQVAARGEPLQLADEDWMARSEALGRRRLTESQQRLL